MPRLDHLQPREGACYLITLSTGVKRRYRFDGFGQHMNARWRDMETNESIGTIPPVANSIEVDCE